MGAGLGIIVSSCCGEERTVTEDGGEVGKQGDCNAVELISVT